MTTTREAEPETDSSEPGLRRTLSTGGLAVHYVTSVMGVGVLVIPGLAWEHAGPLSLVAWAILILYSFPFAMVFARLSTQYPRSGGVAEFITFAFGQRWGRVTAIFLLTTLLVANPLLGIASGRYLLDTLMDDASNRAVLLTGSAIILGCILFNLVGVRLSVRFQGAMLSALIIFLLVVMAASTPHMDPGALSDFAPNGTMALGGALLVCFFGFIGWENAAPVAEEVRDPERTFPRAILLAITVVGALYFGMALTVTLVLQPGEEAEGLLAFASLLDVSTGGALASAGGLVAFLLLLLTTNAWCLGTSRVVYSLARERLLPGKLSMVNSQGTPWAAILFLIPGYGVSVTALLITDGTEQGLITATSAAFLLIFLAAFVSGIRLLSGRRDRMMAWGTTLVTVGLLPFFGISVAFAALLLVCSLIVEKLMRTQTQPAAA